MPRHPEADQVVQIVGDPQDADFKVQVVGDQVVDLTGAQPGDTLVVQPDGTLAPGAPSAGAHAHAAAAVTYAGSAGLAAADVEAALDELDTEKADAAATATALASKSATGHGHSEADVTSLVTDLAAKLAKASNLSDLANAATARANLGALISTYQGQWPAGTYMLPDASTTTLAMVADRLYYAPLWIPESRTTQNLAFETTVAGVGGTPVVRLGIYAPDATGKPGALVVDAGTVDVTVAPGVLTRTLAQALTPGLWWMAAVAQGASGTQPTLRAVTGMSRFVNPTSLASARAGWQQAGVSGALPSPSATPAITGSVPLVVPQAA